jgi:peptidoglycan L-alanyl-D-glutamate endopeptidase CwlK
MNTSSQDRLKPLYPRLSNKIYQLSTLMALEDLYITVAQGLRAGDYQHSLWLQGRNADGSYIDPVHHKGVVTNADAGHSWHEFGVAVDCDILNKDGSIDWNASHPAWKRMVAIGVSLGLTSGATWVRIVDAPHFEITGRFPVGAPTNEVREIYRTGGLQAVWDAIEASLPANS